MCKQSVEIVESPEVVKRLDRIIELLDLLISCFSKPKTKTDAVEDRLNPTEGF